MKKIIYLFVVVLCSTLEVNAQYYLKENNIWVYGVEGGLNFNNASASVFPSKINTNDGGGSAVVCDANGQLLFYTDGDTVFNKNHQVMGNRNGSGLMGAYATDPWRGNAAGQPAVIVPVLDNPQQYYVFSLSNANQLLYGVSAGEMRLFCTKIDMSLNNGFGDIVAGTKGIIIDSNLVDKMVAVAGDNCDMWLIVHDQTNKYKSFEITASGINRTPVISTAGTFTTSTLLASLPPYLFGYLKASNNRRKLLMAGGTGLEICNFDPATGVVSNPVVLDSNTFDPSRSFINSAEFSPDDKLVYTNGQLLGSNQHVLEQYNVSLSSIAAILASKVQIDTFPQQNSGTGDLRLGPDSKIYISWDRPSDSLSIINNPNIPGNGCGYIRYGILSGQDSNGVIVSFPQRYVKPLQDTVHSRVDTVFGNNNVLVFTIDTGYFTYQWNNGSTGKTQTVHDTGTYWVNYTNYCTNRTDTFVVHAATGVNILNKEANSYIKIYPNPAHNRILLKGEDALNGVVSIVDMTGRIVLQQQLANGQQIIDVSSLSSGIYNLVYTDTQQKTTQTTEFVITK